MSYAAPSECCKLSTFNARTKDSKFQVFFLIKGTWFASKASEPNAMTQVSNNAEVTARQPRLASQAAAW